MFACLLVDLTRDCFIFSVVLEPNINFKYSDFKIHIPLRHVKVGESKMIPWGALGDFDAS